MSAWFPEAFPPELIPALEHPSRRRILRALHRRELNNKRGTASDIQEVVGLGSLREIDFHLRYLLEHGLAFREGCPSSRTASGQPRFRYGTKVGDDERLCFLLTWTELIDGGAPC